MARFASAGAALILAPAVLAQQFWQCPSTPEAVAAPITNSVALAGLSGVNVTEKPSDPISEWTDFEEGSYPHTIQILNNGTGNDVVATIYLSGPSDELQGYTGTIDITNGLSATLNIPKSIRTPSCVQTLIRIVYPSTALTLPRLSASSFISNIYLSVDATLASLDLSATASSIISTAPLTVQSTATFASTSGKINTGPSITADTLLIGSTFGDIAFDNAKFTTANISATAGHVASAYVDVARSLTVGTTAGTVTLAGVDVGAGTALAIGTNAGDVKVTLSAKTFEGSVAVSTIVGSETLGAGVVPGTIAGHGVVGSGGGASLVVVATVGDVAPGGRTASAAVEGAVWFGPENPAGTPVAQQTSGAPTTTGQQTVGGPTTTGQPAGSALKSGSAGRWDLAGSMAVASMALVVVSAIF
ncbi:hypothetical protein BDK51DRAFT_31676 [Blyttiomyces helicus]|uniref:DUF4097 domain-containing protein n=1 Tax=Blyttiomyces helicus TaxID=388810 RepID=A0A4P9VW24_9FUNG|nr:hypothetical protein BDK51DRAFT_31676 [Blyttiomyces helicus]|eukprot:RKO83342.1 hypothetical protein BDK51DRAFT_31676 [Blyttiomyces helicus]